MWAVIDDEGRGSHRSDCTDGEAWERLARCADGLGVRLRRVGDPESLRDLAAAVRSRDLVLFLREDDVLDEDGLAALLAEHGAHGQLYVLDSFFEQDGLTYLVLLPGANEAYLRSVDVGIFRFALSGDLVRAVADAVDSTEARAIVTAGLDVLAGRRDRAGLVHCAYPVLRTNVTKEMIAERRDDLIRGARSLPEADRAGRGSVSAIICTKDKGHLLAQLVDDLLHLQSDLVGEIIVVSNRTTNSYAVKNIEDLKSRERVSVIAYDGEFNFSDQCNIAARACRGTHLLFLNDDIVPVSRTWLEDLLEPLQDPTVGLTGPLLLYPDETVQHAGMYLGYNGGAGHTLRHARLPQDDYLFTVSARRDVSCVTGAAMLIRRSTFEDLNGFDIQLTSIFQDVDLCLRILNLGLRILYVPQAVLLHMESVSIAGLLERPGIGEQRGREHQYFLRRHGAARLQHDRFLNPRYDITDEGWRALSYEPR